MKRLAFALCALAVVSATAPAFAGGSGCPGAQDKSAQAESTHKGS